jgi:hypothetical protein
MKTADLESSEKFGLEAGDSNFELKSQWRQEYQTRGFTVIETAVVDWVAETWKRVFEAYVESGRARRIDVKDERGEVADGIGGRLFYDLIDGVSCEKLVPDMLKLYRRLPTSLCQITQQAVICSPYERSKVCAKIYPAGGGQQGAHFDTNGITVILYLTSNEDGCTVIKPLDGGEEVAVKPRAGNLLLMRGRECWHHAAPAIAKPKVISAWNYYVEGDTWRPEWLDDQIYGKV